MSLFAVLIRTLAVLLTLSCVAPALAQPHPTKPVRLIVPFPPGGSTDVLARLLGQRLSEKWGQPVVVENRPGGNTIIGATQTLQSPADGHTLFMPIDFTLTMNQTLYSKLPYDPLRDFTPITMLTVQSLLVSVNPKVPAKSLAEFIAYARANPGKVNYGTGATISQLAGEMMMAATGIKMLHVPFKGSQPTLQALLAGDVDMTISDISPYIPFLKDGKLRGLATTGAQRAHSLPDFPTMQELGYSGFEVRSWFGLVARSGTPGPIVQRINTDVVSVMNGAEVKERLAGLGLEVVTGTSEQFAAQIAREADKWAPVIRKAGISFD
jgi:tripartite-type tricarboxylate transporter receptor subunit TctC